MTQCRLPPTLGFCWNHFQPVDVIVATGIDTLGHALLEILY
jgi:hypothetical protein